MRRLAVIFMLLLLCTTAFAHGGGVDSKGGHTDRSTGEYHYHHGYPAHDHENGVCPYDFDDKTGQNSGTSGGSGGGSSSKLYYKTTANVNLRSSASTSGRILTTVPKGEKLLFMDEATDKWVRVKYKFVTGWVYRDYIEKYRDVVTAGLLTVRPTTEPTPRPTVKPARKELLPVTLGNIAIIFALGLVVGLALLLWYHKKACETEKSLKQEATVRASAALKQGFEMAEASMRDRETELASQRMNLIEDEDRFYDEMIRIMSEKPDVITAELVQIAESPTFRTRYHRVGNCIATGHTVSIQTAKELLLQPCPKCRPINVYKITPQMEASANHRPSSIPPAAPSQSGWRRH